MSKIINKKQLDILIESTLKEFYYLKTPEERSQQTMNWDPSGANTYGYYPDRDNEPSQEKSNEPSQEEIDSATNYISYMKDKMCECGSMVYEGECNECGTSYMKEDGLEEGNAFTGALEKAREEGKTHFMFNGKKYPVEGSEKEDVTEASVKDLAESVTKTFDASFLTEDMDNFKKLINYRNK
jgi:hypothetical protein